MQDGVEVRTAAGLADADQAGAWMQGLNPQKGGHARAKQMHRHVLVGTQKICSIQGGMAARAAGDHGEGRDPGRLDPGSHFTQGCKIRAQARPKPIRLRVDFGVQNRCHGNAKKESRKEVGLKAAAWQAKHIPTVGPGLGFATDIGPRPALRLHSAKSQPMGTRR